MIACIPIRIAASIAPTRYLVDRIAAERVLTEVIVPAGQSPATYDPTASQLAAATGTELYLSVGVPFEQVWLPRLEEENPEMMVLDLRKGVKLRKMHAHGREANGPEGARDPHIWLDPITLARQARMISDALTGFDPERAEHFKSRADLVVEELESRDREIRDMLAGLTTRKFLVFHPAWGYFADRYDLQQIAVQTEGKDPTGKALQALVETAKREGLTSVLVQQQFNRQAAQAVAEAIGGTVTQVDPLAFDVSATLRDVAKGLVAADK